ncbi:MAG: hypothetical protein GC151_15950 [Betaproteobacteria bacterium]|nr:hypothetical protein [Betaproteobacteria bacterium]
MKTSFMPLLPGALSLAAIGSIVSGVPVVAGALCAGAAALSLLCWRRTDAIETRLLQADASRSATIEHQASAGEAAARVGERLCSQFARLDEDLTQVRGIIASATDTLSGSLTDLHTASSDQQQLLRDMVDELVNAVRGAEHDRQTEEIRRYTQKTEEIIDRLVTAIEAVDPSAIAGQQEAFAEMTGHMRDANDRVLEKWQTIVAVSERIRDHVQAGIVSLQFEDMAGQLIEHVRQRQNTVEDAFRQLSGVLGQCGDPAAFGESLRRLESEIVAKFDVLARKSVSQTSVETGSIDLF